MEKLKVILVASAVGVVFAYWSWVWFSYLFVPFEPPPHEIRLNTWFLDGYYKARPGKYENASYGTAFTINSKGFRGPEFEVTKTGRTRVIAVGESSTMGVGSNDDDTWPSKLQKYLIQDGYSVEVINCGIVGANSKNHRFLVEKEVIGYQPDLIIYYGGRNDHAIETLERYPGPKLWPRGRLNFFRHWLLFKRVQTRLVLLKMLGIDVDSVLPWSNFGWKRDYTVNLSAVLTHARRAGVRVVIVTEVLNYPLDVFDAVIEGVGAAEIARRLSMRDPDWTLFLRQADLLKVQMRLAATYDNAVWVDVHRAFRDAKRAGRALFYDDVHLTPEGNDLLGRTVTVEIERYLGHNARTNVLPVASGARRTARR